MVMEDAIMSSESFEILQPVIVTSRILGILPVAYVKHGIHYKLKKSLSYMIYSYALVAVLICITILGVQTDLQMDPPHSIRIKDKKSRFVLCCDISMVIIISLHGTITLPFKLKHFWSLLRNLNQVDSVMPLAKIQKFRRSSIAFMALTLAVSLLIMALDIAVWSTETSKLLKQATEFIKRYGTFYSLYFMVMIQEVFFWHLIFIVKIRISLLNRQLQSFGKKNVCRSFSVLEHPRRNGGQGNTFKDETWKKATIEDLNLVEQLTCLMNCQEKIFSAVHSINDCSAYGIHLIMLSCLVHLVVTPYFLFTELLNPEVNLYYIAVQFLWVAAHIGRLLIIVEPCQQCLSEHEKTMALVCHLLSGKFNRNEKEWLEKFVIQLNCCRLTFNPVGLFKIDRSLITSLAGAVTTYLVILFQFNTTQ